MEGVDTFIDDFLVRHVARRDRKIGEPVKRATLGDQPFDGRGRIGGLQQRPVGAALDALQNYIAVGLKPDRDRLVVNPAPRFLAHAGSAAGGDDARTTLQQPRDHPRLAIAEIRLAMLRENLGHRQARMRDFDFMIGVEKRDIEARPEPPPDGGLARSHHADEHDRTSAQGRDNPRFLGQAVLLSVCDLGHVHRLNRPLKWLWATYTTPAQAAARDSCPNSANMLVLHAAERSVPPVNAARPPHPKVNVEAIAMPSLFRFLTVVAVIGGLIYGAIFALANFVNPKPREMTVSVPSDRFLKK